MSLLLVKREDRVLHLTLNRPQKRNALNIELCRMLVETIGDAQYNPGIGVILIDAAGRVFSAGMDLDEATASDVDQSIGIHEKLFSIGRESRKPIVACVNGPALGGG